MNIEFSKKIGLFSILLLLGGFLLNSKYQILNIAFGQQTEPVRTFTISPPSIAVELAPGERTEGTLKIINGGPNSLNFDTSIRDFVVKDNIGTPEILPPNTLANKYSGSTWVGLAPAQIYASPHQKAELSYFIQVPLDGRPGGHYAATLYTPTNALGVNGTGASVNTSVGTLFYITVKGPVNEKATVNTFTSKMFWEEAPIKINTQIFNLGDIHIRPIGAITLKNILGQKSQVNSLEVVNIFPGAARNYTTQVGKGFMIGRYTASLLATYGKSNATLMATISFWIIPWKLLIFITLMVIAIILGYRYWTKDKTKKDEAEYHHEHTPEESHEHESGN